MDWQNARVGRARSALPLALAMLLFAVFPATAQQRPQSSANAPTLRGATTVEPAAADAVLPGLRTSAPTDFDQTTITTETDGETTAGAAASPDDDLNRDDTSDSIEADIRLQRDRDAFEQPPAGHDSRLFQIEPDPLRDRRTRDFFENEPFAHIGWRLGSFVLFQEFEVGPGWDSNVFFERNGRSDWFAAFRSETRLVSDWSNHAVEFRVLQDRSFYNDFTTENDANQTYELRGRLDVTSRTNVEALAAREVGQESRNSIDATGVLGSNRPDVTTDRITAALNHRFNRLSVQLRTGIADTTYDETSPIAINDRDVTIRTLASRAQWEFRPTLSIFGEVERDTREYEVAAASDGLRRDSSGERYRLGVSLGQTGEFLRGEASIGYGVQRPDTSALPTVDAFLIDANVAWRVTPLTSLLVTADTTFGETTLMGSPGVVNRRIGATLRHTFHPRLIGEAGVSYGTQDYEGATLEERDVTLRTNVEYTFNRHWALFTRYEHTRSRSSDEDRDYDASTILFGARLRN